MPISDPIPDPNPSATPTGRFVGRAGVGRRLGVAVLLGVWALMPARAVAQDGRVSPALDDLMSHFYVEAPLDRVDWMLEEISRTRMLDNAAAASPVQGFFAELFSAHPERVSDWTTTLASLPIADQRPLWVAVWFSNDAEGRRRMAAALKANAELSEALAPLLDQTPPALTTIRPVSTGDLRFLWGAFFASGKAHYIQQISSVLVWDPDALQVAKDLAPMAIYRAVESSLTTNARAQPRVLEICNLEARMASADRKAALDRIIARATAVRSP